MHTTNVISWHHPLHHHPSPSLSRRGSVLQCDVKLSCGYWTRSKLMDWVTMALAMSTTSLVFSRSAWEGTGRGGYWWIRRDVIALETRTSLLLKTLDNDRSHQIVILYTDLLLPGCQADDRSMCLRGIGQTIQMITGQSLIVDKSDGRGGGRWRGIVKKWRALIWCFEQYCPGACPCLVLLKISHFWYKQKMLKESYFCQTLLCLSPLTPVKRYVIYVFVLHCWLSSTGK